MARRTRNNEQQGARENLDTTHNHPSSELNTLLFCFSFLETKTKGILFEKERAVL